VKLLRKKSRKPFHLNSCSPHPLLPRTKSNLDNENYTTLKKESENKSGHQWFKQMLVVLATGETENSRNMV
jgi:hypothetical protein